ncbi:MAG: (2Fe-2S)-binding protein [Pedosphaera sp.]|nr:(2Fe-2S)-binding protein [Pedosphaera sp.]
MELKETTQKTDRRDFVKRALAVVIGGIAGLVPAAAGLMVLLDPLRRKAAAGAAIKVTTLEALPKDGVPRKFPVLANRTDAWNKYANVPVGAVYLRRTSEGIVEAFNVVCPHAGCFVDFSAERNGFLCPCHNSSFTVAGKINPGSPSPRDLDALPVELRQDGEVWVVFQNFKTGEKEKVPVA